MGLEGHVTEVLGVDKVVPAPGQGIIAIESRGSDTQTNELLKPISHRDTELQALAERAFLKSLSGDCNVPLGCLAEIRGAIIHITGVLADPTGGTLLRDSISGGADDAEALGEKLARTVLESGGRELLRDLLGG